jgi:acetyl esterase/lipase
MSLSRRMLLKLAGAFGANFFLQQTTLGASAGFLQHTAMTPGDYLAYVNPEFRPALEKLIKADAVGGDELGPASIPSIRKDAAARPFRPLPTPPVQQEMIPGRAGAPRVPIFIVGASPGSNKPVILHIHGGGFIAGSVKDVITDLQQTSVDLDCVIVSVEYRLAPETIFPGSLEDNYAALTWIHQHAGELGVDNKRVAIKGESAGGYHAAALAIAARDRHEFNLCAQILIYPALDDRTGSSRPVPPFIGHYMWTAANNRFGWSSLLGVPAGGANVPANSVPARVADLSGLPPAFIGVGSIDLFAGEDIEYAARLVQSGVSTELIVVPGAFHGFDIAVPDAPLSKSFRSAWSGALKRAFGSTIW